MNQRREGLGEVWDNKNTHLNITFQLLPFHYISISIFPIPLFSFFPWPSLTFTWTTFRFTFPPSLSLTRPPPRPTFFSDIRNLSAAATLSLQHSDPHYVLVVCGTAPCCPTSCLWGLSNGSSYFVFQRGRERDRKKGKKEAKIKVKDGIKQKGNERRRFLMYLLQIAFQRHTEVGKETKINWSARLIKEDMTEGDFFCICSKWLFRARQR